MHTEDKNIECILETSRKKQTSSFLHLQASDLIFRLLKLFCCTLYFMDSSKHFYDIFHISCDQYLHISLTQ